MPLAASIMPKKVYNIGHNVAPEASFMIIICYRGSLTEGEGSV
jgi:hypothetical protein